MRFYIGRTDYSGFKNRNLSRSSTTAGRNFGKRNFMFKGLHHYSIYQNTAFPAMIQFVVMSTVFDPLPEMGCKKNCFFDKHTRILKFEIALCKINMNYKCTRSGEQSVFDIFIREVVSKVSCGLCGGFYCDEVGGDDFWKIFGGLGISAVEGIERCNFSCARNRG